MASSMVCAMDFDFHAADQAGRDQLIDIWIETWLRPDWAMCSKAGRHTASQVQFVSRFIDIMALMNDGTKRKDMQDQSAASAAAARRTL